MDQFPSGAATRPRKFTFKQRAHMQAMWIESREIKDAGGRLA